MTTRPSVKRSGRRCASREKVRGGLGALAALAADLITCVAFFSRIDLGCWHRASPGREPRTVSEAVRMLPVAAVVIALPAVLVLSLAAVLGLPPPAVAIFALATMTAVTGALHEDGLADIADGFWGGRDRQRRLEIMRDSRIGSYGTLALVFATAAKIVLLAEVIAVGGTVTGVAVLVATAVAARTAALWPWTVLPPARAGGLAHGAGRPARQTVAIAAGIAAMIVAVCLGPVAPAALAVAPAAAALAVVAVARLARAKIGGHTGDVIGGAEQIAEIAFLAGIVISV